VPVNGWAECSVHAAAGVATILASRRQNSSVGIDIASAIDSRAGWCSGDAARAGRCASSAVYARVRRAPEPWGRLRILRAARRANRGRATCDTALAIVPPEESAIAITIRDRRAARPAAAHAQDGAVYCPF